VPTSTDPAPLSMVETVAATDSEWRTRHFWSAGRMAPLRCACGHPDRPEARGRCGLPGHEPGQPDPNRIDSHDGVDAGRRQSLGLDPRDRAVAIDNLPACRARMFAERTGAPHVELRSRRRYGIRSPRRNACPRRSAANADTTVEDRALAWCAARERRDDRRIARDTPASG
jgi:hypothetical protein